MTMKRKTVIALVAVLIAVGAVLIIGYYGSIPYVSP